MVIKNRAEEIERNAAAVKKGEDAEEVESGFVLVVGCACSVLAWCYLARAVVVLLCVRGNETIFI